MCLARREKNIHKRRTVGYSSFWHPKSARVVQCKADLSLDSEIRSVHTPFRPPPAVPWDTPNHTELLWSTPKDRGQDKGCEVPEGRRCPQPKSGVHQDPEGDKLKWEEWAKLPEECRYLWYWCLKTQIRARVLRQNLQLSYSNIWLLSVFGKRCSALCLPR